MSLEELVNNVFIYNGKDKIFKGQKVIVAYPNQSEKGQVIICDVATTERFISAKYIL